jgi:hypothetical protein
MKERKSLNVMKSFARRGSHIHHAWPNNAPTVAALKARQAAKIRQLGEALVDAGYRGLDDQAKVLGLSRSTTWTILKASHKSSGLSSGVIKRMLSAPDLPPRVKLKIFEYIEEKSAGLYGDEQSRVRKFAARIAESKRHQV